MRLLDFVLIVQGMPTSHGVNPLKVALKMVGHPVIGSRLVDLG
jgi:hypothetical protein